MRFNILSSNSTDSMFLFFVVLGCVGLRRLSRELVIEGVYEAGYEGVYDGGYEGVMKGL